METLFASHAAQRNAMPLGFVISGSTSQLFQTAKEAGKTHGEREGGKEKKIERESKTDVGVLLQPISFRWCSKLMYLHIRF